MVKYRGLFLEEAAEHLADMGKALLDLEKDTASAESIDVIFRMAHSIKSMAASLGYDPVMEVSHALEDRMETIRSAGCVPPGDSLRLLFRGLEGLEQMVAIVSETGETPPGRPDLVSELTAPIESTSAALMDVESESTPPLESSPEPPDAAELDVELAAVMAALEAEAGSKKKLLN
jgi:two-component system, chemotaxis family, sensor kinase CheA